MSRLSLRARLAAAAAASIVLALTVLGVLVYGGLRADLRARLDRTLRERAGEVARLSASAPALLTAPGALEAPLGGRPLLVQVLDSRGRTLARTQALGADALPAGPLVGRALAEGRAGYGEGRRAGEPLRLYAAPLAALGGPGSGGAVVVGSSTEEIDSTLRRLRGLGGLSALLAGALAAGAAALMARRALRPLERLSAAASEIERTGDARRRLPAPAGADEVARLAGTLNAMLAALERARQAERRFVGDASHELRTPLTALRGNAAFVARHGPDPEALADLEADAARLSGLLDDLLSLAREDAAGALPDERVRLDALVAEAAGPDVEVAEAEPLAVRGDGAALRRALGNLVDNARRHGQGTVQVGVRRAGDRAQLWVADEGPGLDGPAAEHAFERFWRAPDARGRPGSGLGLAIVAATAERHGGAASVSGPRFALELPLAVAPEPLREPSRTAGRLPA